MVETEASDDDHQPAADVVDGVEVGAGEAHEGLLHHVLGSTEVPEHPEGDVEQVAALDPGDVTDTGIESDALHGHPPVGAWHLAAPPGRRTKQPPET